MEERIEEILKKLSKEEYEEVKAYIENHENRIKQLEENLRISADILQGILDQIRIIQMSLNTIYRLIRPIVRVRESGVST